jgi:O-antigen biosynthesis protein WbqP
MKRVFDFSVAFMVAALLALPILAVALMVRLTSPGPILYWSDRAQ